MATTYAGQSTDLNTLLDSVGLLTRTALGWAAERVMEWHFTGRPDLTQGRAICWYQLADRKPDTESGAGRHGTKMGVTIVLNLATRGFLDGTGRDRRLGRDHWANQFLLENAFYGRMLHDNYLTRVGAEPPLPPADGSANVLSTGGTMTLADIPAHMKPRSEEGWVVTQLAVSIPCVLKVSLNDVPTLTP